MHLLKTSGVPPERGNGAPIVAGILVTLAVPAALTLLTVRDGGQLTFATENPTPYGYTVSLTLFLIPALVMALWLHSHPRYEIPKKAFWATVAVLVPLGFGLDLFFGNTFFCFPNEGAVIGWYLPGWNWARFAWIADLPIEEFIFYISGFVVCLLTYLWLDEYWLGCYDPGDLEKTANIERPLVQFSPVVLGVGITVGLAAVIHDALGAAGGDSRFPGYFLFLVAASMLPTSLLFKTASPFINWRAVSLTMIAMLLVSLMWEATLASPFGWWRYHENMMLGIYIDAWRHLPLEAVFVWILVTFTTVVFYETVRQIVGSNLPLWVALFGPINEQEQESSQD